MKCKAADCPEDDVTPNDVNEGYCRDCSIERQLDSMECSGCGRMRYRKAEPNASGGMRGAVALAEALWGERCECPEPQPPSRLDLRDKSP